MSNPPPLPPQSGGASRHLTRLGCLMPVAAVVLFLVVFLAWPRGPHQQASDLHTTMFFVTLALIPLSAVGSIVISVMAAVRARRSRRDSGAYLWAVMVVIVALVCVALTAFIIYMALLGLAGFR